MKTRTLPCRDADFNAAIAENCAGMVLERPFPRNRVGTEFLVTNDGRQAPDYRHDANALIPLLDKDEALFSRGKDGGWIARLGNKYSPDGRYLLGAKHRGEGATFMEAAGIALLRAVGVEVVWSSQNETYAAEGPGLQEEGAK